MRETNTVLGLGERVLWEGVPVYKPFLYTDALAAILVGCFLGAFVLPMVPTIITMAALYAEQANPAVSLLIYGLAGFFLLPFLSFVLYLLVGHHIHKAYAHRHIFFAITNRRIIIQEGIFTPTFKSVNFEQMVSVDLRVGFWDRHFGGTTGSISITTAGSPVSMQRGPSFCLWNIERPEDIYRHFKTLPPSETTPGAEADPTRDNNALRGRITYDPTLV